MEFQGIHRRLFPPLPWPGARRGKQTPAERKRPHQISSAGTKAENIAVPAFHRLALCRPPRGLQSILHPDSLVRSDSFHPSPPSFHSFTQEDDGAVVRQNVSRRIVGGHKR